MTEEELKEFDLLTDRLEKLNWDLFKFRIQCVKRMDKCTKSRKRIKFAKKGRKNSVKK